MGFYRRFINCHSSVRIKEMYMSFSYCFLPYERHFNMFWSFCSGFSPINKSIKACKARNIKKHYEEISLWGMYPLMAVYVHLYLLNLPSIGTCVASGKAAREHTPDSSPFFSRCHCQNKSILAILTRLNDVVNLDQVYQLQRLLVCRTL